MSQKRLDNTQTIAFRLSAEQYELLSKQGLPTKLSPGQLAKNITLTALEGVKPKTLSDVERLLLEELIALRAIFLTLLSTTGFNSEQVRNISSKVDKEKFQLAEMLLQKHQKQKITSQK